MIPWIQVYSNLPRHPKTTKLADELGLTSAALNPNTLAVGLVVSLWTWAVQNAYSGDLSGCSPRAIAEACSWKKKPETLVSALVKSGFLDADMKLHDWDDYTVMYQELQEDSKIKHRERQRRYRERKKENVTVTSRDDESDVLPNITVPNLTKQDNYLSGGGDDARACVREEISQFCHERNLEPDAYFGMTDEIREAVKEFTAALFARFTVYKPTEADAARVFRYIHESRCKDDEWRMELSQDRKQLLMYAFEIAGASGKPGDWKYIDGVLDNLGRRGIRTLREAEEYDFSRVSDRG